MNTPHHLREWNIPIRVANFDFTELFKYSRLFISKQEKDFYNKQKRQGYI